MYFDFSKAKPKNYLHDWTPHWWNDFTIFCDLDELNPRQSCCTSPPFLFTFTWSHVINIPLQSQLLSPTEGFPLCRHWLLCVWNRRGRHSCAQAPNEGTNSCRNNPDSHWECKPIRCSEVAASLKVDNQCLCEAIWCQQAEKSPSSSLSVLLPELCRWFASPWKWQWIILDEWSSPVLDYHSQIWWLFLVDYWWSESSFLNWILAWIDWQQEVSTSWEVGHNYSSFLSQTEFILPSQEPRSLSCLYDMTYHSLKQRLRGFQFQSKCFPVHSDHQKQKFTYLQNPT